MGRVARAVARRSFSADLVEQGRELIAQAASRCGGIVGRPTGLLAETRGDSQGLAGIAKIHLVQVVIFQAFEMAFGDLEDGFGQGVLAVTEGLGAGRRIEQYFALQGVFGLGVFVGTLSGAGFDAAAPVEIARPALDGAQAGADFSADGGIATLGAQFQVSAKGLKGTIGFAPGLGKEGGNVRLRVWAWRGREGGGGRSGAT